MSFVKREYSPGQTTITSENLNDIQDELIRLEQDKYEKPSGGIPKTDLADAVKASLGKADSALQSVPDTYRTASDQDAIDAAQDTEISDLESALKSGEEEDAIWHLGFYLDENGDLCQVEEETNNG